MRTSRLLILLLLSAHMLPAQPAEDLASCLPQVSLPLTIRLPDGTRQQTLLQGGLETPLSLVSATTGQVLWSAGDSDTAIQSVDGMDAGFAGSLTALDLDADGVHDRIYAGDLAARLWRLDLHQGEWPSQWVSGGILGDFSNGEGRLFLAAPDVSMVAAAGAGLTLHIAIGTASPGNARASNRFYVVRDPDFARSLTASEFAQREPLQEDQLTRLPATVGTLQNGQPVDADGPGWFVEVGTGHVVARSLTLRGQTVLSVVDTLPRHGQCEVFARVATLDLLQQRLVPAAVGSAAWQEVLPRSVPLTTTFQLTASPDGRRAHCAFGSHAVAACDLDTRPRKSWWLRTDAP